MTPWTSFLDQRTTRAAVVLAVVLHVAVLLGFAQYSRTGHAPTAKPAAAHNYQPIEVVLVAESAVSTPVVDHQTVLGAKPYVAVAPMPLHTIAAAPTAEAQLQPAAAPDDSHAVATATAVPASVDGGLRDNKPTLTSTRVEDAKPDYAYNPQPDYPLLLREQGVGGVVWLRVWVDTDGHPGEIKLAKGSGYRLLDDSAVRAVRQWRFVPAKKGDQSLASWVEFPIRFTLNG